MDTLRDAARVNLALAIKALIDLGEDPYEEATAVCNLLGGYTHVIEANTENLTALLERVNNGY